MQKIKNLVTAGLTLLFALALIPASVKAADSATMYLAPSSGTAVKDSLLSVDIHEDSGSTEVNGVSVHLTYPTDKLEPVNITSSSRFNFVIEQSYGNGSVKITRLVYPPETATGDQIVASVDFKVLSDSGTAALAFGDSQVTKADGSGSNILTSATGASFPLANPTSPAALSTTTPLASSLPKVKDTIRPKILDVKATQISYGSAVISWKTSEPATSEVSYGINSGYGLSYGDRKMVTEHSVVLKSAFLMPANTYHYMVKSVDPAGNAASSSDSTFRTKGYSVPLSVINQDNEPVPAAKVTLADRTGRTDKNGRLTLNGLPLGKQTATVTYRGTESAVNVDIQVASEGKAAPVVLKINTKEGKLWLLFTLVAAVAVIAMFAYVRAGGQAHKKVHAKVKSLRKSKRH